ncbi:uncharacterized protein AKAW2_50600A [Aspergillus luchuensis]|uniref:Uncharacterized protein n=1 Tax=Aspergillus kawachii TaxID=1069201 RepID=A0A7R7WC84_ASPKA|nr:uncharacterized protein AKAW2_50600A [Aspergillus luchuensis]BCS00259.1 hypothetical protein AKAW2_50600A [Aspergillus luchuensis]
MRAKNTWKPSVPSTISHQIGTQATQEHVLDSNSSRLRPILNPRAEAQNADQIIPQLGIQQQSNNNVMSFAPMGIHSSDNQVPVPALLEGPTTLGRQQVPADLSRYRFCDSMLVSAPQFPFYDPLDDSALASAASQFPVYDPLDDSALASAASQFPVYDPLSDSALASAASQFPVYDPLDDSALASAASQFPVYDPLNGSALASAPEYRGYDLPFLESSQALGYFRTANPAPSFHTLRVTKPRSP